MKNYTSGCCNCVLEMVLWEATPVLDPFLHHIIGRVWLIAMAVLTCSPSSRSSKSKLGSYLGISRSFNREGRYLWVSALWHAGMDQLGLRGPPRGLV